MIDLDKLNKDLAATAMPPKSKERQTKIGIFRELYPAICMKLKDGWRHAEITQWLGTQGIEMTVRHFRVCLHDIDTEHGYVRSGIKTPIELVHQQPVAQTSLDQVEVVEPALPTVTEKPGEQAASTAIDGNAAKETVPIGKRFEFQKDKRFVHPATPDPDLLK